jgi:hypothetical protein
MFELIQRLQARFAVAQATSGKEAFLQRVPVLLQALVGTTDFGLVVLPFTRSGDNLTLNPVS